MTDLHVTFKVAGSEYVVAASDVVQMESYRGATKVPGTVPWVAGLVMLRGKVVPVIDLRVRFGLESIEPTIDSRVVVVQQGSRLVGLLVDSARSVVKIQPDQFRAPPAVLTESSQGWVKSVAQSGQQLLMLIDFDKVIGKEELHGR